MDVPICQVDGCSNKAEKIDRWFKKKCTPCKKAKRALPEGTVRNFKKKGVSHPRAPKGERFRNQGYVYINGKAEHRLVMESVIGRPLVSGENVHHINGVKDDNRPENLELWTRPQPTGIRVQDTVAYMVKHYPQLVMQELSNAKYAFSLGLPLFIEEETVPVDLSSSEEVDSL